MSKTWKELIEENRDKILEQLELAKKEAFNCMQGWHIDVEMDSTGDVWTGGLASQGSQSMSSFNSETHVIASIGTWTLDDMNIDEDEIIKHPMHEKLNSEFKAQKEDGYEYAWEFMQEKYPDIKSQWEQEAIDFEIEETDYSMMIDDDIEQLGYEE